MIIFTEFNANASKPDKKGSSSRLPTTADYVADCSGAFGILRGAEAIAESSGNAEVSRAEHPESLATVAPLSEAATVKYVLFLKLVLMSPSQWEFRLCVSGIPTFPSITLLVLSYF